VRKPGTGKLLRLCPLPTARLAPATAC